jgi:hypothetical protein
MSHILQISDGHGGLLWYAPFRVLALLLHPDDECAMEKLFEAMAALAMIELGDGRRETAEHAARATFEMDRARDSGYGITVAGDLLLLVLNLVFVSPREASIARAVSIWSAAHARAKNYQGNIVAASRAAIMAAWSRFKPIAHLCAAFQIAKDQAESPPDDIPVPTFCNTTEELLQFLGVAEALRYEGERHSPLIGRGNAKGSSVPTLDPASSWRTPPDLVLPNISLGVPPLTDWTKKALAEYRVKE